MTVSNTQQDVEKGEVVNESTETKEQIESTGNVQTTEVEESTESIEQPTDDKTTEQTAEEVTTEDDVAKPEEKEDEDNKEDEEPEDDTAEKLGITDEALKNFHGDNYEDSDIALQFKVLSKSDRQDLQNLMFDDKLTDDDATKYGEMWADNYINIVQKNASEDVKNILKQSLSEIATMQIKNEFASYKEDKEKVSEYQKILSPEYSKRVESLMETVDQRYIEDFNNYMVDKHGELIDNLSSENVDEFIVGLEDAIKNFNSSNYKYNTLVKEFGEPAGAKQAYADYLNSLLLKVGATGRVLNHTEPQFMNTVQAAERILAQARVNPSGSKEYTNFYKMLRSK